MLSVPFLLRLRLSADAATTGPITPTLPLALETSKLALGALPQPLQDPPHLREFALQPTPGLAIGPLIQHQVDLALDLRGLVGGVIRQRLGHEFDVEGRLHEGGEGVTCSAAEGAEECCRNLLEVVGQDLVCEGCRRGCDFRVHEDQGEQDVVDVGLCVVGPDATARFPGR